MSLGLAIDGTTVYKFDSQPEPNFMTNWSTTADWNDTPHWLGICLQKDELMNSPQPKGYPCDAPLPEKSRKMLVVNAASGSYYVRVLCCVTYQHFMLKFIRPP